MTEVLLPTRDGTTQSLVFREPAVLTTRSARPTSRAVFAACHVVADPRRASIPVRSEHIDWDTTLDLRRQLWALGLGVAESMDTAQRGMGLSADDAMSLAQRTLEADPHGGRAVVVGISTDALDSNIATLEQIGDAYLRQLELVESMGGTAVVMPSRHLARVARSPRDYVAVYQRLFEASRGKLILHWLGKAFDPTLSSYWGSADIATAIETVVELIVDHAPKVSGVKISLLDPTYELQLRIRLPRDVQVFTGDDFNYVEMIAGDGVTYSHALLGAFAAVGRYASAAMTRLDVGDVQGFRSLLEPTLPLSRLIFEAPTQYYKVGITWLAYLTGQQAHFRMLGGYESGRTIVHLADIVREADRIGLFPDPDLTAERARTFFTTQGVR